MFFQHPAKWTWNLKIKPSHAFLVFRNFPSKKRRNKFMFLSQKNNNMEISHGSWMHFGSVGNKSPVLEHHHFGELPGGNPVFWRLPSTEASNVHWGCTWWGGWNGWGGWNDRGDGDEIGMRPGFFGRVGNGWNVGLCYFLNLFTSELFINCP